jgi:hypothetical protein
MYMTKEAKQNARRERVPFGGPRARLSADHEDGYHYHWFNDIQDRIQRAKDAGYEHVYKKDAGSIGDPDVGNKPDGLGSAVSKRVNENLSCYLMRIKQEFFDADRKLKDLEADQVDSAIFKGGSDKVPHSYGLDVRYRRTQ